MMCFVFNDTATTEIYTLSLHDALPIFDHAARVDLRIVHHLGHDVRAVSPCELVDTDLRALCPGDLSPEVAVPILGHAQDRKSTRLNSSHANISYAVFCLKKHKR